MISDRLGDVPQRRGYYPFLTGLKGIAIIFIVAFHLQFIYSGFPEYINKFLAFSSVWINIFFIVSACTLTTRYWSGAYKSVGAYMFARLKRIAPAYYVMLIVTFLAWPLMKPSFSYAANIPSLLHHLLFANTAPFDPVNQVSILGIEWYVPVQFWLYLFVPLTILLIRRSMILYTVFLLLAVFLHWQKEFLFHYDEVFDFASGIQNFVWLYVMAIGISLLRNRKGILSVGLLICFFAFVTGVTSQSERMYMAVAFALVYYRIFLADMIIRHARKVHHWLGFITEHLDVAVLSIMLYKYVLNWYFVRYPHEFMAFWSFALIVAAYQRPFVLTKLLENRWVTKLGEYSYEIYLTHYMMITAVGYIIPKQGPVVRTLLIIPAIWLSSYVLHKLVHGTIKA